MRQGNLTPEGCIALMRLVDLEVQLDIRDTVVAIQGTLILIADTMPAGE